MTGEFRLVIARTEDAYGQRKNNLERALLAAIDDNDLPAADGLIRSGADVNRRGPLPLTALMLAAGRGSTQMVGKLLAAGADVHAVDSTMGASALHFAAQGA